MRTFILVCTTCFVVSLLATGQSTSAQGKAREAQDQTANVTRAKMDLMTLDNVVAVCYVREGVYPETLESLTKTLPNRKPLMTEALLKDPWGRLYRYEPQTLHPKTQKPLIYSHGPDPADPKSRITNWDALDNKKK